MSERSTKIMVCDSCGSESPVKLDSSGDSGYPDGYYFRRYTIMESSKAKFFEDLFGCSEECAIEVIKNKDLAIKV